MLAASLAIKSIQKFAKNRFQKVW